MIYNEECRDLFSLDSSYSLVHCISSDFKLGAGIALKFREMGVVSSLCQQSIKSYWDGCGYCLFTPLENSVSVFNLVTKGLYFHKPTYQSLTQSLIDLKHMIRISSTKKIAMPRIGCGLDKLNWDKVSHIIKTIFNDLDIEILVCYL